MQEQLVLDLWKLIVRANNTVRQMQTFTQAPDPYSHLIHTFHDLVAPLASLGI
jgi:hypothetical protein